MLSHEHHVKDLPKPDKAAANESEKNGQECSCGGHCSCHCKHWLLKIVAALILFLAGFGLACMCHCGGHHYDGGKYLKHIAKQMRHTAPNYTDGAGNVIIINTDGKGSPAPHKMRPHPLPALPEPSAVPTPTAPADEPANAS